MRAKRWLLWLGLPVLALGVFVFVFQWSWFIPLVQSRATAALGRPVTFTGMQVHLGRVTEVTLTGVRIDNPDGFPAQTPFATIDTLLLRLDGTATLHARAPVITHVAIDGAAVEAASLQDGRNNYTFDVAGAPQPEGAPVERSAFQTLAIAHSRAHVTHAALRADFQANIETREEEQGQSRVQVDARGTYGGHPLTASITGGSILAVRDAARPWPIDATVQNGPTRGRLVGALRNPLALGGADVRLELAGPDMALLRPLTGIPIPRTPPYQVTGKLDYADGRYRLTEMAGRVGSTDLGGTVTVDPHGARPDVTADLRSRRVNLADLAGFIGGNPAPGAPAAAADGHILPSQTLNIPAFHTANVHLRYHAAQISGQNSPLDNLDATLDLVDGVIRLHPLRAGVGRGEIVGDFTLTPQNGGAVRMVADARFSRLDISRLLRAVGAEGGGSLNGRARLDGVGHSTQEILAHGNGAVTFGTAGGNLNALLVNLAGLRLGNAVLSAFGIPSRTNLECFVADFALQNGVLNTRAMLLETEDATLLGSGTIRLSDERLDYRLLSQAKHFTVASLPTSLGVSGTISNPSVFPIIIERDNTSAFGQFLNVIRAPLSLVPIVEFGIGDDQRCENVLGRTQPAQAAPRTGTRRR